MSVQHRTSADTSGHGRLWLALGTLVAVVAAVLAPALTPLQAAGQEPTPPPNTFGLRLEGFAVEKQTESTSTAVQPRSAYSYTKLSSFLDLDGSRGLDMEARGANDQYQGFEGAVIFDGGTPTDGNNLPGYTQAFFPTFEGFYTVSEKCATNQTEAGEEHPECRDQDGPYALAKVVPDQDFPSAVGIGRNQGNDDGQGNARSSSRVEPQPDGSVTGVQHNSGSDAGVPGTPIMVDSYLAEQTVTTSLDGSDVEITCDGEVSLGGQQIESNKQLQQALAPLTVGGDLRVEFRPPTEPTITELPGGAFEATCRGPQFKVWSSPQGGTGNTYTYGRTFAAVGVTDNRERDLPEPGGAGGFSGPPASPPTTEAAPEPTSPPATSGTASSPTTTTSAPAPAPATTAPSNTGEEQQVAGPDLVREEIDSMPIGLLTGVAAGLLPLGIWLLLGVTGSLARGTWSLRLPPFGD